MPGRWAPVSDKRVALIGRFAQHHSQTGRSDGMRTVNRPSAVVAIATYHETVPVARNSQLLPVCLFVSHPSHSCAIGSGAVTP